MVEAAPVFCGVKLSRPAGENASDSVLEALAESPSALVLLFRGRAVACVEGTSSSLRLLFQPLRQCDFDADTLTLLGVDEAKAPVFAAAVAASAEKEQQQQIQWTEVVPAAARLPHEEAALAGYAKSRMRLHIAQRFCPSCGALTERRPMRSGVRRFCSRCKGDVFTRTDPVAIVLVQHPRDKARCLLVRKAVYVPANRFTCVAGFIEPGESAEEGACREVLEETGVVLDPASVRFVASQPWPSDMGGQLMLGFQATALGEEVTVDHTELEAARWFSADTVREALSSSATAAAGELAVPGPHALANVMLRKWLASLC